jgi:maltose alpha-D-glucosyltransferase/alpha-amylase
MNRKKPLKSYFSYERVNARVKKLTGAGGNRRLFAERLFPERPSELWAKARQRIQQPIKVPEGRLLGPAIAGNAAYIRWLRNNSMLRTAEKEAVKYAGKATMWQNPYAKPRPRAAIKMSSVWYTAYPASLITKGRDSILNTYSDEGLWQAFQDIGITGFHTGPMKYAGGVDGWKFTPSVDGHFDRISNQIDRLFGTETEFRRMAETAGRHGALIIDDLIPGHTGKGFDFRLAEMAYGTYPGIYHMIEIPKEDWHLLPAVPKGQDSVNLSPETEAELQKRKYIIGRLPRVIFYEPGIKDTNWSVTPVIRGVDGIRRRWVYLHFFKQGQPTINWLDPSFSGMKLVIGDALHSIDQLGSRGLRLDANGFLGIEKSDDDKPAWSEGHPLSEAANHLIAGSVRKVGGFTFQEFNVQLDDMQAMATGGADLSYDFVSRPGYHHALATGDVAFLRLMLLEAKRYGIEPVSLVHALQNHDELTYELVHFMSMHKDDLFDYRGGKITGAELREQVQQDLRRTIIGDSDKPYNLPYTENGIACTTGSVITAVLGIHDLENITAEEAAKACKLHLLLSMFNALQPGVFAISGWDLRGVLTLDPERIPNLLADGDTRWINRGAYDIMGINPSANISLSGLPKATCLYPSLPEQLADPKSFASQLKHILAVREQQGLALGKQLDIPEASHHGVLAIVHQLPRTARAAEPQATDHEGAIQMTVLNFTGKSVECTVRSSSLPTNSQATDALSGKAVGSTDNEHTLALKLKPYQGMSLQFS